MHWTPIAFREDDESKSELQRRVERWKEMAIELDCTVDLH
jgi:hypothetical protein